MPSIDIVVGANPIYLSYVPAQAQTIQVKFGAVDSVNTKTGTVVLTDNDLRRVTSITSSATPTPNCDTTNEYEITALATDPTFGTPTGTPTDGQKLLYRIKDNGTSRALTLSSGFVDLFGRVPSATTISKITFFGARYSSARGKWEIIAGDTER